MLLVVVELSLSRVWQVVHARSPMSYSDTRIAILILTQTDTERQRQGGVSVHDPGNIAHRRVTGQEWRQWTLILDTVPTDIPVDDTLRIQGTLRVVTATDPR